MPVTRLVLAGVALALSGLAATAEPPLPSGLFQFGGTRIMCVKEPCPRIGVMLLKPEGMQRRSRPIYSGAKPPKLRGSSQDRAAIERAWSVEGCLVVDGAFVQPAEFDIRRVVGDCGR